MTQFETTKATILFVEVPEDARHIHTNIFGGCWLLVHTDSRWQEYELGDKDWQFITLLKDAREEDAMTLVDDCPYFAKCWKKYDRTESIGKGATIYNPDVSCWTAIESLHSLANSLGVKGNCAVLVKGGG